MTDSTIDTDIKKGSGKADTASVIAFFSVLIALLLAQHYPDTFKQLTDNGWPLPLIAGVIAGLLARILTWWASESLTTTVIGWVKNWKLIKKEINTP